MKCSQGILRRFQLFSGDKAVLFTSKETIYYDIEAKSNDTTYNRIVALSRIIHMIIQ